jgi:hypothetical protein
VERGAWENNAKGAAQSANLKFEISDLKFYDHGLHGLRGWDGCGGRAKTRGKLEFPKMAETWGAEK